MCIIVSDKSHRSFQVCYRLGAMDLLFSSHMNNQVSSGAVSLSSGDKPQNGQWKKWKWPTKMNVQQRNKETNSDNAGK